MERKVLDADCDDAHSHVARSCSGDCRFVFDALRTAQLLLLLLHRSPVPVRSVWPAGLALPALCSPRLAAEPFLLATADVVELVGDADLVHLALAQLEIKYAIF